MLTEPFQGLAATFAANLGVPGYHAVVVPHPVSSRNEDQLRAIARAAASVAADQLCGA